MFRFLAVAWSTRSGHGRESADLVQQRVQTHCPQLQLVCSLPGLTVFCSASGAGSNDVYTLPGDGGVVLGRLMPRNVTLDEHAAELIRSSRGRHLFQHHWGRYVAFVHDADSGATHILRDPTGGLPCFFCSHEGAHIFFSRMEDCAALGLTRFSINWRHVAEFLVYPALYVRDTGIREVSEVQRGERIEVDPNGSIRRALCWDPVAIAETSPIEDVEEAVHVMRDTARACVAEWAACFKRIVLRLSGGLDSSIVLACLRAANTPASILCVNYFDSVAEGDERRYARLAAASAGVTLDEFEREAAVQPLARVLHIPKSARPSYYHFHLIYSHNDAQVAQAHGADAIFGGLGGDQIFSERGLWDAAADYACLHRFDRQFLAIARGVARAYGLPLRRVVMRAAADALWRAPPGPHAALSDTRRLVRKDVVESVKADERLMHPWLDRMRHLPPGKYWHILGMAAPEELYSPLDRAGDAEWVHPLASQPIIELTLRMPVYVLNAGGTERAIARRAFAAELPPRITHRRAKGGLTTLLYRMLSRNVDFVRELLLDGLLVRNGFLDRGQLAALLAADEMPHTPEALEVISQHVSLEAWLRSWSGGAA